VVLFRNGDSILRVREQNVQTLEQIAEYPPAGTAGQLVVLSCWWC